MNLIHKSIWGVAIGVGLSMGMMAGTANAVFCPLVTDVVRTTYFATQTGARLASAIYVAETVSSKKDELKIWERRKRFKDDKEGEEGEETGEEGSEGGSENQFPEGIYYSYMKNATATGSEKYMPTQDDPEEQEKYVREHLFYDSDVSKLTEADRQKVIQLRQSYLEALASEILSLSAGARDSIISELSILKDAKTTAGGVIQQVDLLAQTKKVMIEQKAADILLQAKLLELDAAKMIMGLNPQRIEDPSKASEGGNNDE
ncbi:MAG: hypothetical protein SPL08_04600 [Pseudomonadota bacterium]|nr:hypothetical protein [Pseudomonadota bacterium]